MILIRGIPIAVILCFLYLLIMELFKRLIPNKKWHDFIPYITYSIAVMYGCVSAIFYNMNFYDSLGAILGLLASDSIFSLINKLIPKAVDRFEGNT